MLVFKLDFMCISCFVSVIYIFVMRWGWSSTFILYIRKTELLRGGQIASNACDLNEMICVAVQARFYVHLGSSYFLNPYELVVCRHAPRVPGCFCIFFLVSASQCQIRTEPGKKQQSSWHSKTKQRRLPYRRIF